MSYPEYFPIGCPPKDAKDIEMTAYRFCSNKVISHDDFLSYFELGKIIKFDQGYLKFGISLISNEEKARNMLRLPIFKNKYLAKGITKKGLGVIKQTPSKQFNLDHYTWWLKKDTKPEEHFNII